MYSMGINNISLDQFIELVKEYEATDPIDFGMARIKEEEAFSLVCEHITDTLQNTLPGDRELVLAVALAKAMTESMILNMQRTQNVKPTRLPPS